jgi:RimJ/RimL family protein N-acetyltransferase
LTVEAMTLETERLVLRMFGPADFEAYAAMCGDTEVMRFIGDGQPLAPPMAWRSLATVIGHWSLRGYGLWAVTERASGALVGRVGFWNPHGWPGFELGWLLARSYWGRGFATEAARAALGWAFTQLGQPEVISLIYPDNAASIRVATRLGERLADRIELMGKPVLRYRITRDEWKKGAAACR